MTPKETELEMLKFLRDKINMQLSPDVDIMGFSHYDYETKEYEACYTGPGTPTVCDWKLVDIFISMKHIFEYSNDIGLSFDMEIYEE
jgi:predicted metallo-beta-lactamase superfamily hydrolase